MKNFWWIKFCSVNKMLMLSLTMMIIIFCSTTSTALVRRRRGFQNSLEQQSSSYEETTSVVKKQEIVDHLLEMFFDEEKLEEDLFSSDHYLPFLEGEEKLSLTRENVSIFVQETVGRELLLGQRRLERHRRWYDSRNDKKNDVAAGKKRIEELNEQQKKIEERLKNISEGRELYDSETMKQLELNFSKNAEELLKLKRETGSPTLPINKLDEYEESDIYGQLDSKRREELHAQFIHWIIDCVVAAGPVADFKFFFIHDKKLLRQVIIDGILTSQKKVIEEIDFMLKAASVKNNVMSSSCEDDVKKFDASFKFVVMEMLRSYKENVFCWGFATAYPDWNLQHKKSYYDHENISKRHNKYVEEVIVPPFRNMNLEDVLRKNVFPSSQKTAQVVAKIMNSHLFYIRALVHPSQAYYDEEAILENCFVKGFNKSLEERTAVRQTHKAQNILNFWRQERSRQKREALLPKEKKKMYSDPPVKPDERLWKGEVVQKFYQPAFKDGQSYETFGLSNDGGWVQVQVTKGNVGEIGFSYLVDKKYEKKLAAVKIQIISEDIIPKKKEVGVCSSEIPNMFAPILALAEKDLMHLAFKEEKETLEAQAKGYDRELAEIFRRFDDLKHDFVNKKKLFEKSETVAAEILKLQKEISSPRVFTEKVEQIKNNASQWLEGRSLIRTQGNEQEVYNENVSESKAVQAVNEALKELCRTNFATCRKQLNNQILPKKYGENKKTLIERKYRDNIITTTTEPDDQVEEDEQYFQEDFHSSKVVRQTSLCSTTYTSPDASYDSCRTAWGSERTNYSSTSRQNSGPTPLSVSAENKNNIIKAGCGNASILNKELPGSNSHDDQAPSTIVAVDNKIFDNDNSNVIRRNHRYRSKSSSVASNLSEISTEAPTLTSMPSTPTGASLTPSTPGFGTPKTPVTRTPRLLARPAPSSPLLEVDQEDSNEHSPKEFTDQVTTKLEELMISGTSGEIMRPDEGLPRAFEISGLSSSDERDLDFYDSENKQEEGYKVPRGSANNSSDSLPTMISDLFTNIIADVTPDNISSGDTPTNSASDISQTALLAQENKKKSSCHTKQELFSSSRDRRCAQYLDEEKMIHEEAKELAVQDAVVELTNKYPTVFSPVVEVVDEDTASKISLFPKSKAKASGFQYGTGFPTKINREGEDMDRFLLYQIEEAKIIADVLHFGDGDSRTFVDVLLRKYERDDVSTVEGIHESILKMIERFYIALSELDEDYIAKKLNTVHEPRRTKTPPQQKQSQSRSPKYHGKSSGSSRASSSFATHFNRLSHFF